MVLQSSVPIRRGRSVRRELHFEAGKLLRAGGCWRAQIGILWVRSVGPFLTLGNSKEFRYPKIVGLKIVGFQAKIPNATSNHQLPID